VQYPCRWMAALVKFRKKSPMAVWHGANEANRRISK
jgi:hypothetical protein